MYNFFSILNYSVWSQPHNKFLQPPNPLKKYFILFAMSTDWDTDGEVRSRIVSALTALEEGRSREDVQEYLRQAMGACAAAPPQEAKSAASAASISAASHATTPGKQMPYCQEPQQWDVEAEKVRPTCKINFDRSEVLDLFESPNSWAEVSVDASCSAYTHSFSFFGTSGELRAFLDGMLMSGYCELRTFRRLYDDSFGDDKHQVIRSLRFRRDGEDDWQSFYEDEDLGADRNFGKDELEFEPNGLTCVHHEDVAFADLYPAEYWAAEFVQRVFRGWRARCFVRALKDASAELYAAR